MRKLLITAFALLAFAAGSQARTNDKNTKNMKTIALTKADFLKKVADYEKNLWGIERNGFFNGRGKWVKGFENQRV